MGNLRYFSSHLPICSIAGMTGWDVSRHPEWDLMYAAGLTVREISDHCHVGVATIHAHFRAREKYEPGTRERHEAALAARDPDRPTVRWRKRLSEALDFMAENNRLPRASGSRLEASLHVWLSDQRRSHQRGEMSMAKIILLDQLDGWKADTHQEHLDGVWRSRLSLLSDFITEHGCLPRYEKYADEDEHKLGIWLQSQHQRRTEGKLRPWREAALDAAVPGWRGKW